MNEMRAIPNPFPGLRPFEFNEQHLFFGREGQSEELLTKLRRTHFLTVVGTSGSGKSSLVRAGLLPLLYGGFMTQAGPSWRIAVFRPGDNPIRNMALALNSLEVFEISKENEQKAQAGEVKEASPANQYIQIGLIEAILRRSALGLVDFVRESVMQGHENLLIVVDQFEEIFRFKQDVQNTQSGNEAAAFIKLLLEATRVKDSQIYVALTMRSDFLGDCAQFRDLPEAINEGQYLIPRMTRDQQREAISSPAAVYGAQLAPQLVHRLLNDVGDNPDQLPILQHALMRTWNYWIDHRTETINLSQYQEIGGINNALSLHADEAYNELPDERSRQIAERLFKCLTEKGPDNREIRRPTKLGDICAIVEATEEEVIAVIDVFRQEGRSFLMPPADTELDAGSVIDISHESLIRGWQQLKAWVNQEAESAQTYRRLSNDAVLHEQKRVPYWRDPALQLALDWRAKYNPNPAWAQRYHPAFELAMSFLDESKAERDREVEKEQRQQREEEQRKIKDLESAQKLARLERQRAEEQAKAARRLRWLVAALAVMFLMAAGTAAYAMFARSRAIAAQKSADEQRQIAEKRQSQAVAAQSYAERQTQLVDEQRQLAEKQRLDAERQKKLAEGQKKLAEAQSQRALSAERAAREQAGIAQQAKSKADSEARRANDQAELARKNLAKVELAKKQDELNQSALIAFEQGDTATAINSYQHLLPYYAGDPPKQWWVLHNLGLMNRQAGQYGEAVKMYKDALDTLERPGGASPRNRVATFNRLAQAYREQSNYALAVETYKTLLDYLAQEKFASYDLLFKANIQSDLADIYLEQGKNTEAQPLYEHALEIRRDKLKAENPELIATLNKLSLVYVRQKKYAQAEPLLNEVLAIRESKLEPDHPSIAEIYNSLAALYQEWGKTALAGSLYELSAEIREKNSSLYRSDQAEADKLQTLQRIYNNLKKYDRAEVLYKRELALREKMLKPEDPALATELEEMASFYVEQHKYTEAQPLYERALGIRENALKGNITSKKERQDQQVLLSETLYNAAPVYFELAKYSEAELAYKQALNIGESLYGVESIAVTETVRSLAQLYLKQGRDDDARFQYNHLLANWRKYIEVIKKGNVNPGRFGSRDDLFMSWLPDPDEPGAASGRSVDPQEYVDGCNELASMYARQFNYAEAEALYKESLSTLEWLSSVLSSRMGGLRVRTIYFRASTDGFIGIGELSAQYYMTLADTLEAYASVIRKKDKNREAEASALESRAKAARSKEADILNRGKKAPDQ